jgi:hypothetical protein
MRGRSTAEFIPQFAAMAKKLRKKSSRVCLASNLRAARLLLSPELAYAEIYGAYSGTFDGQPAH